MPSWLEYTFSPTTDNYAFFVISNFCLSILAFQNLVPISLIISIEIIKSFQSYFIGEDIDLYYSKTDRRAMPKSANISDDLGQISHIFSDKTGTLTQNVMEFKSCSVGSGRAFDMPDLSEPLTDSSHVDNNALHQLFLSVALCHSVLVNSSGTELIYKSQSPDEAALINAAKKLDFVFAERKRNQITVLIQGKRLVYQVLNVLEFNSERKRMSVILRSPDNTIILLTKGADNTIFKLLADGQEESRKNLDDDLEEFASIGLRTLCYALKKIPEPQYLDWLTKYQEACISIHDREEAVASISAMMEVDLRLVGATAIEDKLQEGVPECIHRLLSAGIKIWVLTGDKTETAINIGYSCNLLPKNCTLLIIRGSESPENMTTTSEQVLNAVNVIECSKNKEVFSLVIDGNALLHVLREQSIQKNFLLLSKKCIAVICCRVSPKQKANVVAMVKKSEKAVTLAIGDGANDVSMIQEAHIGVGIDGEEGMQAAMAADYVISQFRFLTRLLLVEGRWCYIRTASMLTNFFYKNMIYQ